jgi:hypothetical protein
MNINDLMYFVCLRVFAQYIILPYTGPVFGHRHRMGLIQFSVYNMFCEKGHWMCCREGDGLWTHSRTNKTLISSAAVIVRKLVKGTSSTPLNREATISEFEIIARMLECAQMFVECDFSAFNRLLEIYE